MTKTTATFFLLPRRPALKTEIHKTVIPFVFVSLFVFPLIRHREGGDGVCLVTTFIHLVKAPLVLRGGKLRGVITVTLKMGLISLIFIFLVMFFRSQKAGSRRE